MAGPAPHSSKPTLRKLRYAATLIVTFLLSSTYYVNVTYHQYTNRKNAVKQMEFANVSNEMARKSIARSLPRLPLSKLQEDAIKEERVKIRMEMADYNFTELGLGREITLDDLVMERGGEPIRNFLIATWRSGSSFVGSLVSSHPGTFFEYEPLIFYDSSLVHPGKMAKEALQVLDGVLSCNYATIPKVDKLLEKTFEIRSKFMFMATMKQLYKIPRVLVDPNFYSAMCSLFPFQLIKTVRLGLAFAKEIIENKKYKNLRMLFLVRDPRAIMLSRWRETWWCYPPDCSDLPRLCMQMEEDFAVAKLLREEFPDRFLALRYEDISLNPDMASKKILKFLRLQFHPNVQKFLKNYTTANLESPSLLIRDSRQHAFHWIKEFNHQTEFSRVLEVQTRCSKVMELWGYSKIVDWSHLSSDFMPLLDPPWPEMIVSGR